MSPEVLIIIFLSSLLLILLIIQFFFSNSGSRERIKILLEKQENLEKSIYQIFDEKFEKIDNKFQKSSAENSSSLFQIKEKISIIDRAQQNISGLTANVIDLKNILSNTSKRGKFGEVLLENLISDHLPIKNYEFQKTLSNNCRVDCIIKSSGALDNLCIDAKFPRESFEKILNSTSKDEKNKVLKLLEQT